METELCLVCGIDIENNFQSITARKIFTLLQCKINVNCGGVSVLLQCDTDEIHTCCFTPNGSVFASGPAEAETTLCIYEI